MSADRTTLAVYGQKVDDYARMTRRTATDARLAAFIACLPRGGHVLDLGCGPGIAAAEMARHGLRVLATDAAPEMVALAQGHPGVTARCEDFDAIAGDALHDGIWASFSLLHAPRAAMPRHLAALSRALKPGGQFWIGMKTGTGVRRDALGRIYTYYPAAELDRLLLAAGLIPRQNWTGADPGLDGIVAPWIVIAATRSDTACP